MRALLSLAREGAIDSRAVNQIRAFLIVILVCATVAVAVASAATSPTALRTAVLRAELARRSLHYVTATSQAGLRVRDVADVARDRGIQRFTMVSKSGTTGHLTILVVHSTAYFHGDAFALFALGFQPSFASAFAGKWISIPHNSPIYASFARNVTIGSFARDDIPESHLSIVSGMLGGKAIMGLRGSSAPEGGIFTSGAAHQGGTLTAYIPASGPPLPIEGTELERGFTGYVTMSRWNEPVLVQAPTHSVTIR